MTKKYRYIKAFIASILLLLHIGVISGEYRTHQHHYEQHQSELIQILNCEFGYVNPVNKTPVFGFDENNHNCQCHHNNVIILNLTDVIKLKLKNTFYAVNDLGDLISEKVLSKIKHHTICDNLYQSTELESNSDRAPPIC